MQSGLASLGFGVLNLLVAVCLTVPLLVFHSMRDDDSVTDIMLHTTLVAQGQGCTQLQMHVRVSALAHA